MTNRVEIEDFLRKLIVKYYGVQEFRDDTTIQEFNGINEDNERFLDEFFNHYQIDTKHFEFYDYFYEQEFIVINLLREVLRILGIRRPKNPLFIRDLIDAAKNGRFSPSNQST